MGEGVVHYENTISKSIFQSKRGLDRNTDAIDSARIIDGNLIKSEDLFSNSYFIFSLHIRPLPLRRRPESHF